MTKVLLIEDDQWLGDLEATVLRAKGYEVQVAEHGFAAIDIVDSFSPNVIILDVLLGGATAFTFLNELRSYQDTAKIPIVLCTNVAEQVASVSLKEYGVQRVVDKTTMHPSDLVAAVVAVTQPEVS